MYTFEMMRRAEVTGKTYVVNDLRYSRDKGFHSKSDDKWEARAFRYLNDLFDIEGWKELEPQKITLPKKMTLKEVEEKLGYPIEIISE